MMLSCKEVTHLVSAGLDRKLGFAERVRLHIHLAVCDGCTHFTKHMKFIRKAMRELGSRS
jgi:Putative zinc-finger